VPPPVASRLALEAAAASGLDLVGVDLLPTGHGGYCLLELNGAVDFRPAYSFSGRDVFDDTVIALTGGRADGRGLADAVAAQT
jgi:glutathione synthase/RimK-type ligase-like ATP-grasp enzyme